jgi:excisionase family DNA binding protein
MVKAGDVIGGSNRMIGTEELAEFLGVPLNTIYHHWRAWGLPGVRIGRHLLFRERDIAAWIERRERQTAAMPPGPPRGAQRVTTR